MRSKVFFPLLFLVVLTMIVPARGALNKSQEDENTIELTGWIKIKGSEPHTIVALVTEDRVDYSLVGEKAEELRKEYQLKMVVVVGKFVKEAAPFIPAEIEVLSYRVLKK
jgi:hypothetical protein